MRLKRNPQAMHGRKRIISITIEPAIVRAVDDLADQRGTSRAKLVCAAITEYLEREHEREAA